MGTKLARLFLDRFLLFALAAVCAGSLAFVACGGDDDDDDDAAGDDDAASDDDAAAADDDAVNDDDASGDDDDAGDDDAADDDDAAADEIDERATAPEPPAEGEGLQFVQNEHVVPANVAEQMWCWFPKWTPDQDYLVTAFDGFQGANGHHVVAMKSNIPYPDDMLDKGFDCTFMESMTTLEPLVLPDVAQEDSGGEQRRFIPPGYAIRLKAGARVVIQSHYLNLTHQDLRIADVARFTFAKPEDVHTEVGYFIMNNGNFVLPASQKSSIDMNCVNDLSNPIKFLVLFGHMHEWGRSIKVDLTRTADGSTATVYEDTAWDVDKRDNPPAEIYNVDGSGKQLEVEPGDTFTVQCDFDNDTGEDIGFPREMCTAVGYYYQDGQQPEDPVHICDL